MKYVSVLLVVLIVGGLVALAGWFYTWVFTLAQLPGFARIIIVVVTGGVLVTLIGVAIARIFEIKKEEKDDLGKY